MKPISRARMLLAALAISVLLVVAYRSFSLMTMPSRSLVTTTGEMALVLAKTARSRATDGAQGARGEVANSNAAAAQIPAPAPWQPLLTSLQEGKINRPGVVLVMRDGKLTDTMGTLFGLNGSERVSLQFALDDACQRLGKLERENAAVTRGDDGSVIIAIEPFATSGGAVYDDLMRAFAQTLGAERYAAFARLGAEQVERALGDLGAAVRKVTVRRSETGYFLTESFERLGGSGHSTRAPFATREAMTAFMLGLAPLLPADF